MTQVARLPGTAPGKSRPPTGHTIRRTLSPGLYRLTVDGDARAFDWESLYLTLNIYSNVNQRTGPWDFNLLDHNRPLLPAYWVHRNGRKIGLWYFNRPSAAQIKAQRLRGEASFWIDTPGDYEFRFEPYQPCRLTWTEARIEPEPEDTLLDELALRPEATRGLQRLFPPARWQRLARRFAEPSFPYRQLLAHSLAWAQDEAAADSPGARRSTDQVHFSRPVLPLLSAAARLRDAAVAVRQARRVVEYLLVQPAWGNLCEDGYGYNGDMSAANTILDLAWTLNFLGDELGPALADRLRARLETQGDIFLELALLHRGYWGGSILQDHGAFSFGLFTSAAYSLLGWTPRAETWLRFCLPRMQRTFAALPTDGVVPQSSYHLLSRHTDKVVLFRELHRQATGEDLYERPAWRRVPQFAFASYVPERGRFLHACTRGDLVRFFGGHPFLDQMARTFGNREAAWLAREYARTASAAGWYDGAPAHDLARHQATLWAALLYEPLNLPAPAAPARHLDWFRDSGAILYRDTARGVRLSARCGPPHGLTADRNTTCPCDRATLAPAAGMFALVKHGRPLLSNAESGYRVRTELANVMLVDGQGQLGDHGPPMSCPDAPYGGEHIEDAWLDPQTGRAYARMQLQSAYAPGLQFTRYCREFYFEPDGRIRLVDRVASAVPHQFQWLFHTFKSQLLEPLGPLHYRIQNHPERMTLAVGQASTRLTATIEDTLVVWGYRNETLDESFQHLAFATEHPVNEITVEFQMS